MIGQNRTSQNLKANSKSDKDYFQTLRTIVEDKSNILFEVNISKSSWEGKKTAHTPGPINIHHLQIYKAKVRIAE